MSLPRAHLRALALAFLSAFAAWLALFAAQVGHPTLSSRWAFELLQHKQEISRRVPGPRLVIAGGSSALFGIRATQLSSRLHVPVCNMATYAGLGLPYLLDRLQPMLRPGDTVLLSLEYELYSRDPVPDDVLADFLSARDPGYLQHLPWTEQVVTAFRMDLPRLIAPWIDRPSLDAHRNPLNVYEAPHHMDALGDSLGNNAVLKNDALRAEVAALKAPPISLHADNAGILERFADWAHARGIRMLATHPSMVDFGSRAAASEVAAIDALHLRLGIPFVDRWEDTLYPRADFFDTVYHLDSVAASMRTDALAARIASHLDSATTWGPVDAFSQPDHPLAELAKNFGGWEPTSGFGLVEGPYPQWSLGPVIWSTGTRSELVVRTDHAFDARFAASLRGSAPGQRTELIVNGESAGSITFDNDSDFRDWSAPVRLNAGDNRVELVHTGAKPQAALIKRMRFDAR